MKTKKVTKYTFTAKIWLYPGASANWHFVTVPKKESQEIKERYGPLAKGWGSFPVEVQIGKSVWKTSIFPDSKSKTYILPLKLAIRNKEELLEGDDVTIKFTIAV